MIKKKGRKREKNCIKEKKKDILKKKNLIKHKNKLYKRKWYGLKGRKNIKMI